MEINGTKEETQTIQAPTPSFSMNVGQAPTPSFSMNVGQAPTCSDMFSYKPLTGTAFNHPTGGGPVEETDTTKREMNFQYTQKKKVRLEEIDQVNEKEIKEPRTKPTGSFNLKTLTDPNSDYKSVIEPYLKSYFNKLSNLIELSSDKVKNYYYDGTMFTFSRLEGGKYIQQEIVGDTNIYTFLSNMSQFRKYNVSFFNIQPGLGQGASVFLTGTIGTIHNVHQHKFTMSLQLVRLRKKYYIQNQFFHVE
jgi:hypothetical protein|tara:strand:- start:5150 stop:5896 length:747 start_codon:yes stop_codon:yes gene_type:complete